MVIIAKTAIREFIIKHPDAENALEKWYDDTKAADWKNFAALRQTCNAADSVGKDRYVFNIRGNHYRLSALIIFKIRTVFILFIGTHADYDRIDAAAVTFKP
ncbi:type II toxin-antitoxin system HigB family toxin [Chitinophaga lutea]|uniref:Type II toxin-antitoxin system HigB family toxin n=1 Tax=Chitinophaga lutea TaxID=2488634 RepID=A0A3N4PXA9_9BACT|nr:type II toxin-antitoxin system HigB family toxin [Chitinophaga lutea]RPE12115.1 type II toxin-antitoxin system HigB family toxin [Chitinophaga lutea]